MPSLFLLWRSPHLFGQIRLHYQNLCFSALQGKGMRCGSFVCANHLLTHGRVEHCMGNFLSELILKTQIKLTSWKKTPSVWKVNFSKQGQENNNSTSNKTRRMKRDDFIHPETSCHDSQLIFSHHTEGLCRIQNTLRSEEGSEERNE